MGRRPAAIEDACFGEEEGAGAGSRDPPRCRERALDEGDQSGRTEVGLDTGAEHDRVEDGVAERLGLDTEPGGGGNEATLFRDQGHLIRRLVDHEVGSLEGSDRSEAQQVEVGEYDETDPVHVSLRAMSRISSIYDI